MSAADPNNGPPALHAEFERDEVPLRWAEPVVRGRMCSNGLVPFGVRVFALPSVIGIEGRRPNTGQKEGA